MGYNLLTSDDLIPRQFPDWLHKFSDACNNVGNSDQTENDSNEQCVVNDQLETTTNPRSREPVMSMPKINRKPKAVAMFCTGKTNFMQS